MLLSVDQFRGAPTGPATQLAALAQEFAAIVDNRDFPCIYSSVPFATSEIYFELVAESDQPVETAVVAALRELCALIRTVPDTIGVIFVAESGARTLTDDFELASRIVGAVLRQNALDNPGVRFPEPHDSDWELWLAGVGLFLNFSSPRHTARRSRNVGSRFTIVAQERASFDRHGRGTPAARERIRQRLGSYDDVAVHPSLGSFYDPDCREVLQFFLGDGTEPMDPSGAGRRAQG